MRFPERPTAPTTASGRPWWRSAAGVCLLVLVSAAVVSTPGCGGCSRDPAARKKAEEEKRKKEAEDQEKKKPKDPFEFGRLVVEPWDETTGAAAVKPGHWTSASQLMKANNEDFHGELDLTVADKSGKPVYVDRTRFLMSMSRPVALSKGRDKRIETTFFTPPQINSINVQSSLRRRGSGAPQANHTTACTAMPSYQYYFVILAKDPQRYAYVKTMYSVRFPFDNPMDSGEYRHYRVVAPDTKQGVALPSNPLAWSSIAYVLWDELAPDALSAEQQRALIDWLHWGGQIIVSGPGSLDLLRKSFLAPHLPAEPGELRVLGQDDVAELAENWTLRDRRRNIAELQVSSPWSGIELKPTEGSIAVEGTGGLLVERQVGRGRIVASAFQLDERDLLNWRGNFDSFFNACLLRRPPRRWLDGPSLQLDSLVWADAENQRREMDARLVTGLRYFSRDSGTVTKGEVVASSSAYGGYGMGRPPTIAYGGVPGRQDVEVLPSKARGGIGAWNDFSDASNEAREVLRVAAGVQVPRGSFVIGVLAAYLFVLVPLNYVVFYTLGRLEWAWVAAPAIAAVGTVIVVWQAQLDIGFVRSQTEIGILEVQGGHPRGHLTRYTAVYTSLGSSYELQFDDPTALIAPFPDDPKFELLMGQSRDEVIFRKHDDVRLTDLGVDSSTTTLLHSEQMFDLGGPLQLGTSSRGLPQVVNHSDYDLSDVAVLRRTDRGLTGCWIGNLRAHNSAIISLGTLGQDAGGGRAFYNERQGAAARAGSRQLDLSRLVQLAQRVNDDEDASDAKKEMFPTGETRLVGRINEVLPGMTVEPEASQSRGAVLVVAHLEHPPLPVPQPDVNSKPNVLPKSTLDYEELEYEELDDANENEFGVKEIEAGLGQRE